MDLFSGLSGVYSETWPVSGMTRSGQAFELPTLVPPTSDTGCSSLPTPRATRGGSSTEMERLLVTPNEQLAINGGSQPPEKRKAGGHGPTLADQIENL